MKGKYFWFNVICISVSVFFMAGIVLVWVKIVESGQTNSKDLKIKRLEDYTTTTIVNNLSILQSSNLTTLVSTTDRQPISILPTSKILIVPFTSQAPEKDWSEPWQDACEEAALLMLDAYYKNYQLSPLFARDEILKIVDWEEKQGWGNSIEMEKIKQIAEEYFKISNFKFQISKLTIIENPTIEDIKKSIVAGNPVLVVADGKVLPNPHFRNGGPVYHALIIKGYDEENFITNDPGTQFGEGFKYKYQDLINAVHDWNGGDVANGMKVALVIE